MACMEHTCNDCGKMVFNNNNLFVCPKCGSQNIASYYDEQDDYDREEDEGDMDCEA
jgi:hypothetical protein